jgi:hypothetical protein
MADQQEEDEGEDVLTSADIQIEFQGDEAMWVHSHVLILASPVFRSMLGKHGMQESTSKRIAAKGCARADFTTFYRFLSPATAHEAALDNDSAPAVLHLADYYQVPWLKTRCVRYLEKAPVTVPLTILAKKFMLGNLYKRCIDFYGKQYLKMTEPEWISVMKEFSQLKEESEMEIFHDILVRVHKSAKEGKEERRAKTAQGKTLLTEKINAVAQDVFQRTPQTGGKDTQNRDVVQGLRHHLKVFDFE